MPALRPTLALILMLVALAAPAVGLARASAQGLLVKVLTFDQARERSREDPAERDAESEALRLANFAAAQDLLGTSLNASAQAIRDALRENDPAAEQLAAPLTPTEEASELRALSKRPRSADEWGTPPPLPALLSRLLQITPKSAHASAALHVESAHSAPLSASAQAHAIRGPPRYLA